MKPPPTSKDGWNTMQRPATPQKILILLWWNKVLEFLFAGVEVSGWSRWTAWNLSWVCFVYLCRSQMPCAVICLPFILGGRHKSFWKRQCRHFKWVQAVTIVTYYSTGLFDVPVPEQLLRQRGFFWEAQGNKTHNRYNGITRTSILADVPSSLQPTFYWFSIEKAFVHWQVQGCG